MILVFHLLILKWRFQRYQWKVLPQGMKNSPTLSQKFVDMVLLTTREKFHKLYLVHYVDDILMAHKERSLLQKILLDLIQDLQSYGFLVVPEKIQVQPPFNYLGRVLNS